MTDKEIKERAMNIAIDLVHYEPRYTIFNNKVWKKVYKHFMNRLDKYGLSDRDFLDLIVNIVETETEIYPLYVPDAITGLDIFLPIYELEEGEEEEEEDNTVLYGIVIEFNPNLVYKALQELIQDMDM